MCCKRNDPKQAEGALQTNACIVGEAGINFNAQRLGYSGATRAGSSFTCRTMYYRLGKRSARISIAHFNRRCEVEAAIDCPRKLVH
jgi:hypothetical protein